MASPDPSQRSQALHAVRHRFTKPRVGGALTRHGLLVAVSVGDGRGIAKCLCGCYAERFDGDPNAFVCVRGQLQEELLSTDRRSVELERELDVFLASR